MISFPRTRVEVRLELLGPAEAGTTMILPLDGHGNLPLAASPQVELEEPEWERVEEEKVEATLRLHVRNPKHFGGELTGLTVRVWLAGRMVASSDPETAAGVQLQADGEATVERSIAFVAAEVRLPIVQLARGRPGSYRLDGTCELKSQFGPLSFTFDTAGTAPFRDR